MKILSKKIIYGCEARGDADSPYLTRWTLIEIAWLGAIYLHIFHRSDSPEAEHDHPWNFVSIILWRGYFEWVRYAVEPGSTRRRKWPGMILFRRATHIHRVELVDDKPAVTLMLRGPYVRTWGFWEGWTWTEWKKYFTDRGC